MKDHIINGIVEGVKKMDSFYVEFYCIVDDNIVIPEELREVVGDHGGCMISLNNISSKNPEYNFEKESVSWIENFGGRTSDFRLEIPLENVIGVTNRLDIHIQFNLPKEEPEQEMTPEDKEKLQQIVKDYIAEAEKEEKREELKKSLRVIDGGKDD